MFILLGLGAGGFFIFSKTKSSTKSNITTSANPTAQEGNIKEEISKENSCDKIEKELQEKYKQNYDSCFTQANTADASCKKSEGLADAYKEYLNIIIILDSSGSMAEGISGGKKMDIAKKVLNNFVENLPERAWVGLMAYGHKGSSAASSKALSCAGIEMVYPLSALNKNQLMQAINSFQPTGYTPIAGSLQKAKEILASKDPEKTTNIIYLISDGIETCDGDPVAVAKELNGLNVQTLVNIVGFGVDGSAQAQLKATAQAGGGEYFSANSADEMEKIFNDRNKYLKSEMEYRDCIQSSAMKNRDEIQKVAMQVRDCIQDKALEERDGIQKEVRALRDNKKLNQDCFSTIHQNAQSNFSEIYGRARDNAKEIYDNARDNASAIYKKSLNDWNEIYKNNK